MCRVSVDIGVRRVDVHQNPLALGDYLYLFARTATRREHDRDIDLTPSNAGLLIRSYTIPAVRNSRVLGGMRLWLGIGTGSKLWILYNW